MVPQFYYLWPSLMAVFSLFLGPGRMFYAMTCMALLSLWGIFLMGRRMLGRGWAWVAALLAALSPLMVYFSKYATSEMFTMALFVAACLALLASPDEEPVRCSPRLAALSAALLFLCFLARIDMYIVLPPLLAVLFWRRVSGGWERADTVFTLLVLAGFTLASLLGYWSSQPYFTSIFHYGLEGAKGVAIAGWRPPCPPCGSGLLHLPPPAARGGIPGRRPPAPVDHPGMGLSWPPPSPSSISCARSSRATTSSVTVPSTTYAGPPTAPRTSSAGPGTSASRGCCWSSPGTDGPSPPAAGGPGRRCWPWASSAPCSTPGT